MPEQLRLINTFNTFGTTTGNYCKRDKNHITEILVICIITSWRFSKSIFRTNLIFVQIGQQVWLSKPFCKKLQKIYSIKYFYCLHSFYFDTTVILLERQLDLVKHFFFLKSKGKNIWKFNYCMLSKHNGELSIFNINKNSHNRTM